MIPLTKTFEATLMNARMQDGCFVAFVAFGDVGFDVKAPPHVFSGRMKSGDRITIEYEASGHMLQGPYVSIRPAC